VIQTIEQKNGVFQPLYAVVARLKEKGYQFLSDAPSPGAHGCQVIFIHPKSCDGVLIEINQPAADH